MDTVFLKKDADDFSNLCANARINRIMFTKAQAARFVGGRYALEKLVKEKKIRMVKSDEQRQNAYWLCHAEDVFRNCSRYI